MPQGSAMRTSTHIATLLLLVISSHCFGQVVTPEPPETPVTEIDDITVELVYLGVSQPLTEKLTTQAYAAYAYDDELGLAIADLGRAINKGVQVGGRYVFFGSSGNSDQHSFWAYLNAEKYLTSSWRIDTRQVIEYRFDTSGVAERTRYRPRFRVSYLGQAGGRQYQVYTSVEPIFNLTTDDDDQISWAAGGFLRISKSAQFNLFYQFTETDRGPDFHFPGIGVLFSY